jgi:uncharacterized protein YqjF (DUF2071 family)
MRLPKHPVPMTTIFRRCLLVNFAVEPAAMAAVLPPHISADVHAGNAYLSVVVAQMEKMRPAFAPRPLGITYDQIVYRVVVRCGGERGVHFLRSDANSRVMCVLGNALSFFGFHRSRIRFQRRPGTDLLDLDVATTSGVPGGIRATYDLGVARRDLPESSAFTDLSRAQRWLVELFAAFAYTPGRRRIDVVRIERGDWDLQVVDDLRADYDFLTAGPFPPGTTRLDSVFLVGDIPYRWHRLEHAPILGGKGSTAPPR